MDLGAPPVSINYSRDHGQPDPGAPPVTQVPGQHQPRRPVTSYQQEVSSSNIFLGCHPTKKNSQKVTTITKKQQWLFLLFVQFMH
jgi:hypothetical protein